MSTTTAAGNPPGRQGVRAESPVRIVTVTVVSIALAEILAMAVVHVLEPPPFWPATLLDAAVMIALTLPPLYLLVFRPLVQLMEDRARTETANAELDAAERRVRREADTLASAVLAINRSLDLESVLSALLEHLGRLVPYDRAKVMLFDGESRLRVRAISNPAGRIDFPDRPFDTFEVSSNDMIRAVIETARVQLIPDTHAHPDWAPRMRTDYERSWLGVPLVAGGRAIGLYTLVKGEAGFFTPDHVRLAEALSAPASVAVAHARLFGELEASRHRLRDLAHEYVSAHERERRRIARELHDEAGQLLASLTLGLRVLEHEADRPDAVLARACELKQVADSVQEGLHRLAADLRPAALDRLGLAPALRQLARAFSGNGGPKIQVEALGFDGERLSSEIETALYRIAQEALTNTVRHSGATEVSVVAERRNGSILLVIEDDGRGFDPDSSAGRSRLGLLGVRERAEMLGGDLLVESRPGSGTTLVIKVPDVA
jgi:signal transduction histidine kinase